jgi:hypothetical protein
LICAFFARRESSGGAGNAELRQLHGTALHYNACAGARAGGG